MVKHSQVFFGLCIALVVAGSVFGGSSCTVETCGDGPVAAYFQYANCTGEVSYVAVNRNWDVCEDDSGYAFKATLDAHGFYDTWFYGNGVATCTLDLENATYWRDLYKFGACVSVDYRRHQEEGPARGRGGKRQEHSAMSGAFMYLPNVNASYGAQPAFDNQPLIAFPGWETSCYSADNCTNENGQPSQWWYTYYSSYQCQDPYVSYSNARLPANTCANYYNSSYYMNGCIDSNTLYYGYFTDAGCSQPYQVSVWHTYCSSVTTEQVHCTATPTEIPSFVPTSPQTPTSSASFSQISLLMALFASIFALFMF